MPYAIHTLEVRRGDRVEQLNQLEAEGWVLQFVENIEGYFRKDLNMEPWKAEPPAGDESKAKGDEKGPEQGTPPSPDGGAILTGTQVDNKVPTTTLNTPVEQASNEHYLVNRLKCACGFSVNPATRDKLVAHLAEHGVK
jgi:hypothetical protein